MLVITKDFDDFTSNITVFLLQLQNSFKNHFWFSEEPFSWLVLTVLLKAFSAESKKSPFLQFNLLFFNIVISQCIYLYVKKMSNKVEHR